MPPTGDVQRLDVPHFSVAERDRRWSRVRELMARDDIDVIVAPSNTGAWEHLAANTRYLTGIGGHGAPVAAVFPADGEVTAITGPVPTPEYWRGYQDWVTDIRPSFFGFGRATVDRLRELGVDRSRIGFAGLAGLPRRPEGAVTYGDWLAVREAFPEADLVNAQPLLEEARYRKSDEEVAFLGHAVELVERAIEVLAKEARPGVSEASVYGRMVASMVEGGGELPTLILWSAGNPQPARNAFGPTTRRLQRDDVISAEIEARYAGYCGQVTIQAVVGSVPDQLHQMFQLQQRAVDACYQKLRPGATLGELIPVAEQAAEGSEFRCQIICHGRGLGDDPPITIFGTEFGGQDARMRAWPIETGATLIVKPLVSTADRSCWVCWGDSVVVTEAGPQRLGRRPAEILELG